MRLREDIEEVGGENMFLQQMIANHCGKFEYVVKTQNLKSPIQKLKLRAEIWTFRKRDIILNKLFKKKSLASKARNIFL